MIPIIPFIVFFITAVIVSIYDIKTFHIPLFIIYISIGILLIYTIFLQRDLLVNKILGMILMPSIFLLSFIISHKKMGLGDIQFALLCGFISGSPYFILSAFLASLSGIVTYIIIHIKKNNIDIKALKIPFIPFMSFGTIVSCILMYFL